MSTRVHTRPSARQTPGLRPQTRAPFLLDLQQVKYTAYLFSGLCPTESNPPARPYHCFRQGQGKHPF